MRTKPMKLTPKDRQYILEHPYARVKELAAMFNCSTCTINYEMKKMGIDWSERRKGQVMEAVAEYRKAFADGVPVEERRKIAERYNLSYESLKIYSSSLTVNNDIYGYVKHYTGTESNGGLHNSRLDRSIGGADAEAGQ